jgi:hypothetical protein
LLVVLGAAAAGVRFNDQLVGLTGDNASYILLGRDLLTGQRYENAGYPWGYPALLAPILAAVGTDNLIAAIPWLKLLTILFYIASLPVIYALLRSRQRRVLAFAATMLFAVNLTTLLYANDTMSELPYTFFSFCALLYWQRNIAPWAMDRAVPVVPWRRLALAGLLLVLPYYIRTAGVALLAAPVLVLAAYRRWRAAGALGIGLALGALPWLVGSRGGTQNNYLDQLLVRDPYNPALGSIAGVGEMAGRIWSTLWLYVVEIFPRMLLPEPVPAAVEAVIGPMVAVLMLVGLARALLRRVELPEVYLVLFMLVLAAWPWKADRFILPVYPLLLHYALEGGQWLAGLPRRLRQGRRVTATELSSGVKWGRARVSSVVLAMLVGVLAVPNLYWDGVAGAQNLRYLRGEGPPSGHTPDWIQYFAACRWLKEHTAPGSLIMSRKTTLTELYADRASVQIPLVPPADYPRFLETNHVSYILEDGFVWSVHTRNYLEPALRSWPDLVRLEYATGPPETRIWCVVSK